MSDRLPPPEPPVPSKDDWLPVPRLLASAAGMDLRDWFAGQALIGIAETGLKADYNQLHIASVAYRLADGMMEERAKEQKDDV